MNVRARAVIIYDDAVLLIHRLRDGREYYKFPGGGVEPGETPEQAVARECREELGVSFLPSRRVYEHVSKEFGTQIFIFGWIDWAFFKHNHRKLGNFSHPLDETCRLPVVPEEMKPVLVKLRRRRVEFIYKMKFVGNEWRLFFKSTLALQVIWNRAAKNYEDIDSANMIDYYGQKIGDEGYSQFEKDLLDLYELACKMELASVAKIWNWRQHFCKTVPELRHDCVEEFFGKDEDAGYPRKFSWWRRKTTWKRLKKEQAIWDEVATSNDLPVRSQG